MIQVSFKNFLILFGIMKTMDMFARYNLSAYVSNRPEYKTIEDVKRTYKIAMSATTLYGLTLIAYMLFSFSLASNNIPEMTLLIYMMPLFLMILIPSVIAYAIGENKIKMIP